MFRPQHFEPTFNKYVGELCNGVQMHVTDRDKFDSLKTSVAIIYAFYSLWNEQFRFTDPPYEYDYKNIPVDILLGSSAPRIAMEQGASFSEVMALVNAGKTDFLDIRLKYLMY